MNYSKISKYCFHSSIFLWLQEVESSSEKNWNAEENYDDDEYYDDNDDSDDKTTNTATR